MNKLINKGKGISFDDVDAGSGEVAAPDDRPRTAIGAITASLAMGRGVETENRELKERLRSLEDAIVIELLDPKKVRPSRFANRHALSFAGPEFAALKAEIASAGRNVQPIKVRLVKDAKAQTEYEIAFGHRRHRACLELGISVAAIVEDLTDAALFAEMERENRERQDLSPWEQGSMYKRALDEKLYPSIRKMASALGAQSGNVSTAVQLASLPDHIIAAFPSPLVLQFRWAAPLTAAVEANPDGAGALARQLSNLDPKLPAKEVFSRLTGAEASSAQPSPEQFLSNGKVVGFWDRDPKGNISVRIKAGGLPSTKEKRLREFLQKLFD